jgi:hypothetical protein
MVFVSFVPLGIINRQGNVFRLIVCVKFGIKVMERVLAAILVINFPQVLV